MWSLFVWLRIGTSGGCCEDCDERSDCVQVGRCLDYLSYCKVLKEDSASSSQSNTMREETNLEDLDMEGLIFKQHILTVRKD